MRTGHRRRQFGRLVGIVSLSAGLAVWQVRPAGAVNKDVDLDGACGIESVVSLDVISTSPVKIRNTITNKALGKGFTFNWPSSGPGGFASSVAAGTALGVGTIWDWQTTSTIYSLTGATCPTDICFTQTTSPGAGTSGGPFSVPGRSLSPSGVTLSNASLTSSLLAFFSPPVELVTLTSNVQQLASGMFRYTTRVENKTPVAINFDLVISCTGTCSNDQGLVCKDDPTCQFCDNNHNIPCNTSTPCPPGAGACGAPGTCIGLGNCSPPILGQTVQPGMFFEVCRVDPHPSKEELDQLFLCGGTIPDGPPSVQCANGQPASQGMAVVMVPNPAKTVGSGVFLTPYQVHFVDANMDGTADELEISLLNAGPLTLINVTAELTSPPVDLTNDGSSNQVSVDILPPFSPYPDILGTVPSGPASCGNPVPAPVVPSTNLVPFRVTLYPGHPHDVGRPFNLNVSGQIGPGGPPFQMDVPLTIGFGSPGGPLASSAAETYPDTDPPKAISPLGTPAVNPALTVSGADPYSAEPGSATFITPCNDGDACSQTDTCTGGTCVGSNPVVCSPLDQCHVAGTCNSVTGQCSNPNASNGTPCSDGNACTANDACSTGACNGAPITVPTEVTNLRVLSDKQTLLWDSAGGAGPGTVHDLARGLVSHLPVGTLTGETCPAPGITPATKIDTQVPPMASAFWYDVRGRNTCGVGPYGVTSTNVARVTSICP